ncbi:MAG: large conductance mechanosensitive channel protein MscL [Formosimonas sp.]|jgi:large conductance mechanosensitive channel
MWKEFKEFALKGPVLALAVGVIIGAAMGKIVDSVVKDLIMPLIGYLFGGKVDFSNMLVVLGDVPAGTAQTYEALSKAGVPVFAYGNFVTTVINFFFLALAVFMIVKIVNKASKEKEAEPAATPEEILLLREIRDNLLTK